MNLTFLAIVAALFILMASTCNIFAQGRKLDVEVLAFDKYADFQGLRGHAKALTLVGVFSKTKAQPGLVLIRHQYFGSESPLMKSLRLGKRFFRMKLERDKSCDQTLESLEYLDETRVPQSKEPRIHQLEWLTQLSSRDRGTLPCYVLRGNQFSRGT